MTLRVYDTQRAKKVEFKPVHEGKVGIYFCGMTVQDKPHMGHMLAFVAGDMIRRYLEYKGYQVSYIQNFTDIDDKIIDKANTEGIDYREVAERNMKAYFDAAEALHIRPATKYPLATEHIQEIIDLIQKLVDKRHAYEVARRRVLSRPHASGLRASSPSERSTISCRGRGSPSGRTRRILSTSRCGRHRNRTNPAGKPPGDADGRDGTSSARRCR